MKSMCLSPKSTEKVRKSGYHTTAQFVCRAKHHGEVNWRVAQPLLNLARAHYAPTQQSFPRKKSYFKEEEEGETEPEKNRKSLSKA